jgi:hypothetical protein
MGMVHERPRVVRAGGLDEDDTIRPIQEFDSNTFLEVQDPRQHDREQRQPQQPSDKEKSIR